MIPHAFFSSDFKATLRRVAERNEVYFVRQLSSNLLKTGRKCRCVLYEDTGRAASIYFQDLKRQNSIDVGNQLLTDKKQHVKESY